MDLLQFKRNPNNTVKLKREEIREKFIRTGLKGFLDYEIIELLLTLGTPGKDCRKQSLEALEKFKTLRGVLEAPSKNLLKVRGLGPQNIFGIKLVQHVSRRFLKEKMMKKPFCHSSREVFDYLFHSLRDAIKEKFKVIFLDAKNQILEERTFFEGTVDSSAIYPREIIKSALESNATSMIFVHNHPSGDPEPSQNDKNITRELVCSAQLMQLKVLDHIIIGNNRYFSFADSGLIDNFEFQFLSIKKKF